VGIIGGGLAFVLFFNGLAHTTATPAAFLHDTLVIWVLLLAGPFLHERAAMWNVAAIALLVGGEVALSKGMGHLAWGSGTALVLAATLLWAVEVVVAKRLLAGIAPASVSLVRMGVGSAALLVYLAAEGSLGSLFALNRGQLGWVMLTGLLLAGYVGTWMTALSRARAIDVTSILVASALITAVLQALAGTQPLAPEWLGLVLITAGTGLVAWRMPRRVMAT
jgi:drug/metabolite transporter (DMT)-like permease